MLVHSKIPKGILDLGGYKIYGKDLGREPTDIPFEIYNMCRDGLQDGTYREGTLARIFGKPFPEIAFTYSEIRWLPESILDRVGPLIVSNYDITWSHKKKVDQIKKRIADGSP